MMKILSFNNFQAVNIFSDIILFLNLFIFSIICLIKYFQSCRNISKHTIINFLIKYNEISYTVSNSDQTDMFLKVIIYKINVANIFLIKHQDFYNLNELCNMLIINIDNAFNC